MNIDQVAQEHIMEQQLQIDDLKEQLDDAYIIISLKDEEIDELKERMRVLEGVLSRKVQDSRYVAGDVA